jgi:DNA-binding XRE family transcriptional regulator
MDFYIKQENDCCSKEQTLFSVKFEKRIFVEVEENLVKKTCRELGITQKELAERIGISRQTVSDWATGKAKISTTINLLLNLLVEQKDCLRFKNTIQNELSIHIT